MLSLVPATLKRQADTGTTGIAHALLCYFWLILSRRTGRQLLAEGSPERTKTHAPACSSEIVPANLELREWQLLAHVPMHRFPPVTQTWRNLETHTHGSWARVPESVLDRTSLSCKLICIFVFSLVGTSFTSTDRSCPSLTQENKYLTDVTSRMVAEATPLRLTGHKFETEVRRERSCRQGHKPSSSPNSSTKRSFSNRLWSHRRLLTLRP